ncbi:TraR/DksA family transcriptional regulator [Arthrobacter dokdonensis]|uniref:TraR/DksA family transcriptional regulator n=1 Tax=Arthrobacter dokdonellae TaxID=2211210 RepID=UPI000DE596BA|nr:TraR/DksA C4-type zinc finger protein [Arthrobacter dokdonellae]
MPHDELFRELLAARVEHARGQVTRLRGEIREVTLAHRDTPADDEHDPEGSTVTLERERAVALLAFLDAQVAELREAQERLAHGTFGICERCGQPVPAERLEIRPEARHCVTCAGIRAREH